MRIYNKIIALSMLFAVAESHAGVNDETPTINPTATYTSIDGEETETNEMSGQAPLVGKFKANPSNVGDYEATYEWRFTKEGETNPYLTRYEEDTEYTFNKAGSHSIVVQKGERCYRIRTRILE